MMHYYICKLLYGKMFCESKHVGEVLYECKGDYISAEQHLLSAVPLSYTYSTETIKTLTC